MPKSNKRIIKLIHFKVLFFRGGVYFQKGLQHLGLVELAKDWTCLIFFYSVPEFFSPKFLNGLNHHEMPSEPVAVTGSTCGTYWVHGGVFFNVYFAPEMEISCI